MQPAPVETKPLQFREAQTPEPSIDEVLVHVRYCGVCRTDLHVVEGELPTRKSPIIPGHQVIGVIEKAGANAGRFPVGTRIGIPWLDRTDGTCRYCLGGSENLCDSPEFTGYTVNGGYAEYIVAPEKFIYGKSTGEQLDVLLNTKSGLLGISGISGDMRQIVAAMKTAIRGLSWLLRSSRIAFKLESAG